MNPVALKTAQKVGYPVDHIVGNVWSNSEEDAIPAGDAAKGYVAITTQASGEQYPVVQEIVKTVYGAGKGNLEGKKRIGSVYHNLGIVNGILNVEAIRIAQGKFGHRTLTGDEVRWGFEHLQLDAKRVEELGAKGLFHSINVTWQNHEGDGYVTFQQWDGAKWNVVSDWIAPDWALLRPIIEKSAAAYAAEKGIKPRTSEDTPATTN
jgi:branched-chain amino acid transport system substrate-binding protein